jgi:hypothetical protein
MEGRLGTLEDAPILETVDAKKAIRTRGTDRNLIAIRPPLDVYKVSPVTSDIPPVPSRQHRLGFGPHSTR